MANSINRVELLGRLGEDPKAFGKDGDMCSFCLATSDTWKDKETGEKKEQTEWHNVKVFNKGLAGVCLSYLEKGSRVALSGKLQTNKYTDKDGVERYATNVVIPAMGGDLVIIDFKDGDGKKENKTNRRRTEDEMYNDVQRQKQADKSGLDSVPSKQDFDDDLPF